MALTKTNGTLTQLTATGDTGSVDTSASYAAVVSLVHVNGTGTITAGATIQPQISHDGTNWINDGGAFQCGTTASATERFTYVPPADGITLGKARFAYTAPTGSTGHTLDASYSLTTGV